VAQLSTPNSVKHSPKRTLAIVIAALSISLCAWLIPPELRYRRALQKYKPGITAEAIERDYGVHLDLRPSGNILSDTPTDEQRRRHPAYEAYVERDFVVVAFNADRESIDVTKLTPLKGIQKLFRL
jgi:hypothetical protein